MGRAGLILLGVLLGAGAGLTAGLVLVYCWFELLHLPALDDDPKGLSTAAILLLPSIAVGATAAPMWLVKRRAGAASLTPALVPLLLLAGLAVLLIVGLTL